MALTDGIADAGPPLISLRESQNVGTLDFSVASRSLKEINEAQVELDRLKDPVWKDEWLSRAFRAETYAIARAAEFVPVLGGVVSDLDEKLWSELQEQFERTAIKRFETRVSSVWAAGGNVGGIDRNGARKQIIDAPAAQATAALLLRQVQQDFDELPERVRSSLLASAVKYLAKAVDASYELHAATAIELQRLDLESKSAHKLLRDYQAERSGVTDRTNREKASLKQSGTEVFKPGLSLRVSEYDKTQALRRQIRQYMEVSADRLDLIASTFGSMGNAELAKKVKTLAQGSRVVESLMSYALGSATGGFAAIAGLASLVGPSASDPNQQLQDAISELDKKIDKYHAEVMQELGQINVRLMELQSAGATDALGKATQCLTWLQRVSPIGDRALVDGAESWRVPGAVADFRPFHAINRAQIKSGLYPGYGADCVEGLKKVFTRDENDHINPAIELYKDDASNHEKGATLSQVWEAQRRFLNQHLSDNGIQSAASLGYLGIDASAYQHISPEAKRRFIRATRPYDPAAVTRYASYAAAVHFYPAVVDPTLRVTGEILSQEALWAVETSLAQVQFVFGGPIIELAAKLISDPTYSTSQHCRTMLKECSEKGVADAKVRVGTLLKLNAGLRANVGIYLLSREARRIGLSPLAYSFAVRHADETEKSLAIDVAFGGKFPFGQMEWDAETKKWTWRFSDNSFQFPVAQRIDSQEYIYPGVFYELIRVGRQLSVEVATYKASLRKSPAVPVALRSGVFPPSD